MKRKIGVAFFLFVVLFMVSFFTSFAAAVAVNINSYYPLTTGPTMPFPQFINYTAGGARTLYTVSDSDHQPAGVSHAEMEKWMRDAWLMDANRFTSTTTVTYQLQNGSAVSIPLIKYNSTCTDCSESAGYYLLSAAMMGDKQTFDGIWFYLVENGRLMNAYKYSDGSWVSRGTGRDAEALHFLSVYAPPGDSATDGDMDVAMAMLMAWKQWGDFTGYYAAGGQGTEINTNGLKAIKYKELALASIRFLVALGIYSHATAVNTWITGDIGFDGYHKGGQTWREVTSSVIASSTGSTCGPVNGPFYNGPVPDSWYDYTGPSYFRAFANALTTNADPIDINNTTLTWCDGTPTGSWNVTQLLRAMNSNYWLQGQLNSYTFPVAGQYTVNGSTAVFNATVASEGEDFRSIWRHSLDYMLYGNPTTGWNPATLTTTNTGNQVEYDASLKIYNFFKNYSTCLTAGTDYNILTYAIPELIADNYSTSGAPDTADHIPYVLGSAAAAVLIGANVNNDFLYLERWYRELSTVWDCDNEGTGVQKEYLSSNPKYFHDFFRLLGLLIITGNYPDPINWKPKANMKIYKAVDKTYVFPGDTLTYWLNYRNYGSVSAAGVKITDTIPSVLTYISSTGGGSNSGQVVTWNLGAVSGLTTQNYSTTEGGVTLVVRVNDNATLGRYCNTADISCTNGTGWTSNEYPNEISYIMKRNCVDVVAGALTLTKTASAFMVNPGNTITYTLNYCNSSKAGWLEGGRPGVIFSAAEFSLSTASAKYIQVRGIHSASEPWIDWGNYRIVYYVNSATSLANWNLLASLHEGTNTVTASVEAIVPGCDSVSGKCWNQRLIFQNGTSVSLPTHNLTKFMNNLYNLHYPDGLYTNGGNGTQSPLLLQFQIQNSAYTAENWADDYSQLPTTAPYYQANGRTDLLFPISEDYTDGDPATAGIPVTKVHRDSCTGTNAAITNMLVEEWDGYCWRRAYGNGPAPGRDLTNVVLIDSLPTGVTFGGFISSSPVGTHTGSTLQWNIPKMLVNECGQVSYWVTANGTCPMSTVTAKNMAYVYADKEAAVADFKTLSITCSYVPPPPPAPSSLTKTADKSVYTTGDNITYTVAYTNINGSAVDSTGNTSVLQSSTNWTKDSGAAYTFGTSGITLPNGAAKYHYNYSNGINGTIYLSTSYSNNSSIMGVSFRNGWYLTFTCVGPGTATTITLWNGTTVVKTATFSIVSTAVDLKIELTAATINMFIKDIGSTNYPITPTLTYTGIPLTAGYIGIINGDPTGSTPWGAQVITKFQTYMDTAFNVHVYDPMPPGVSFTAASNSGVLSGSNVDWGTLATMTGGQSFTYTWYGKVTGTCMTISNIAYAQPQGVTYSVGDQVIVTVNCGGSPTNTPTSTPTYTATATFTPSSTATYTTTNSATPTYTMTASSTLSSTLTATLTATQSSSVTFTNTPTSTRTATLTFTVTDTVSSNTPTYTLTSTNSYTATSTYTASGSPTSSSTQTASSTYSTTSTYTNTNTDTPTYTATYTYTNTATLTHTLTVTDTESSNTPTDTPTFSNTPTVSNTSTSTATKTDTATITPSFTQTWTMVIFTATITPTYTATWTYSSTPTASATQTASPTWTNTNTDTNTKTITATPTYTATQTATSSVTDTSTITPTPMPSPVKLDITLEATGDTPKAGAVINYVITIKNNTSSPVDHLAVWDTLPDGMTFNGNNSEITPTQNGNYLYWDITTDSENVPFTLEPGKEITIEFTAKIQTIDVSKLPLANTAMTDYNDPFYIPAVGKHPAIESKVSFYPVGRAVVYPNPFNLDKDSAVIFNNVVPGSLIQIYTLSGENVKAIQVRLTKSDAAWDSTNRNGRKVSPGIYYFVIKNMSNGDIKKGKIFVIKGN